LRASGNFGDSNIVLARTSKFWILRQNFGATTFLQGFCMAVDHIIIINPPAPIIYSMNISQRQAVLDSKHC
jgi:hypothetical protein